MYSADSFIATFDSWRPVDSELILRMAKGELPRPKVQRWIFSKDVSPLDLYVYLKSRFGPPNGFQMRLKNQSSDNLIHWHWTLESDGRMIEVMGLNMHAEIWLGNCTEMSSDIGKALEERICSDYQNYGHKMSQTRKELEKWHLLINPYSRLRRILDKLRDELKALKLESPVLASLPRTEEEVKQFQRQFKEAAISYERALVSGTSIRMLSPVLGEAFINLVIFLLAIPELKADRRLYNDLIRNDIDIRVKRLHLDCTGFVQPIPIDSQVFKDFLSLMNGRNDFLHGNIDPVANKYGTVHFDGTIPLPKVYKDLAEEALVNSLINVEPAKALRDLVIVDNLIELVLAQLEEPVRNVVRILMRTPNPGWREDTMTLGILFPEHLVQSVVIDKSLDSQTDGL